MRSPLVRVKSWSVRFAALAAAALVVPACSSGGSSGGGPNPGRFVFSAVAFSVAENGGPATITVRRVGGSLGAVSVNYATSDGSAGAADYTTATGTLNWAAGDAADKTFPVTIANDGTVEGSETVLLALSLPGGGATLGTPSGATLTITDDDAPAAGVLQFSVAAQSVSEAGGSLTVRVTRSGGSAGAVGVSFASADGTAAAPGDYLATGAALAWADGETADKTFTLSIVNDALAEADETVTLNLSAPTGGAVLGTVASQTVTILDNDSNGAIQFSAAAFSVSEGGATATITLTRTNGTAGAVGVTIASADGTATAPNDYTAIPAATTVSWGAGDGTSKTVLIPVVSDLFVEGDETVALAISAPTGGAVLGGTTAATLTILDDDCTLQFSSAAYAGDESDPMLTITVTRVGSTSAPVSVQYATAAGTATLAADFTDAAGTLNWAAGEGASKTFDVPLLSDTNPEADETVNLTLGSPAGLGASLGAQAAAVMTIEDNDVSFAFSAAALPVGEAAGPLVVTVTRSGALSRAVSVDWTNPAGGTATGAGADYTAAPATLNFPVGDVSETFNVAVVSDPTAEGDETFNLALANPFIATGTAALGAVSGATATIIDDDINLDFVAASVAPSVAESGTQVTLTLRRLGLAAGAVSVQYATSNGTAMSGTDYTAVGLTTVNWAAGDTADKSFNIAISEDFEVEGSETFTVTLSNPVGATLGANTVSTVTITDNDNPGTLQFSSATYNMSESGPTATITVTRLGGVGNTVSAVVSTSDGTASSATDYTALNAGSGLVTFPAGDADDQTVTIALTSDALVEANETVNLSLGSFTGGTIGGVQTTATLTILDDDVTLQFTAAGFNVGEEDGTINIPVSRVGRSTGPVSVSYGVTGGTAATPADFTHTGTLSWADGDMANKNIVVTVVNDAIIEGNLTVEFTLSSPVGTQTTLGAIAVADLIIEEDDAPGTLQYTASGFSVNEGNVNAQVTVSRSGGTGGAVTADVTFTGGSAGSPADYTVPVNVTLSWAAGESGNKTLNIPIAADALIEGTETILLGLGSFTGGATAGAQATATLSIVDAPGTLQFTASNFNVNENGGTVSVTVSRAGGSGGVVGVTWATSNGTATSGADYSSGTNTLSWIDGDVADKSFNVSITNDGVGENVETFNVALSLPTGGATLGVPAAATVTVTDDDISFVFSQPTYAGNESNPVLNITVLRLGVLSGTDTVQWFTTDGTATSPDDYTGSGLTTLTFNPTDTSQQFSIPIINDADFEGDLTFTVTLANPSGGATLLSPSVATVTITEDDQPGTLAFEFSAYGVNENGGTATISVTRVGGTGGAVSVQFATSNGTATQPGDYAPNSGTLNWAAGDGAPQTFNVSIVNDAASEGNETVNLALSNVTGGATLGLNSAVLTVVDDDATIFLSAAAYPVGEGAGNAVITVRRANSSLGAVTARLNTSNGTATAGSDYTALVNFDVVFNDGDSADKTVNIPITDDGTQEGPESFDVTLTVFAGSAVTGVPSAASVTINDNEGPSVVSSTPSHTDTGVKLDTHMTITFSEAMDTTSVQNAITIERTPTSSPLPTAVYQWDGTNTTLTIVFDTTAPAAAALAEIHADDLLHDGTQYTVTIGTGATGTNSGLQFAVPAVITFDTVVDATSPAISSITPDLAAPLGTTPVFTVTFNESMNTTQGQARIEFDGPSDYEDDVNSTGSNMSVAWINSTQFQITVTTALPERGSFRLDIGGMSDAAGNFFQTDQDYVFVTQYSGTDSTAPVVTGALPERNSASVSRDSVIIIGFSEIMRPSVVDKVTLGGPAAAGVSVVKDMEGEGLPILFIRPLSAWNVGALTVTIDCGAGGAADVKGNLLTPSSGSNYVISYTVVAGTNDATMLEIFPERSGIKDGDSKISESQYQSYLSFVYNLTGFRAYVNASTLTNRDVSIIDFLTNMPVKGHRLETGEEGDLQISRFAGNGLTQLANDRIYTLRLNTTLRTSRGVPLSSPVSYTFSTREVGENAAVQLPRGPEIEVNTFPGGGAPELNLRLEVQNADAFEGGGQTTSVTVVNQGFVNSQNSGGSNSFYNYNFEGVGTGITSTGFRIFMFSATDNGPAAETVSVDAQGYVFPSAELNATLTGPAAPSANTTPTFTWNFPGGTPPSSAHGLIVHVQDQATGDITFFQVLVDRTATSVALPPDRALAPGNYTFLLGAVRLKDPNGGGMVDFGVMTPLNFTITP